MAATGIIDKITALVAKAVDDGSPEEEARTAALQAVRMLKENDLTVIPKAMAEEVEKRVEGLSRELARVKSEGDKKMLIGAALGFGLTKFIK